MKIKKTILTAAILMAAVSLPAQNKSAGINISIWKDICTQPHDSTQTTYINIGLLSTMNRQLSRGYYAGRSAGRYQ